MQKAIVPTLQADISLQLLRVGVLNPLEQHASGDHLLNHPVTDFWMCARELHAYLPLCARHYRMFCFLLILFDARTST